MSDTPIRSIWIKSRQPKSFHYLSPSSSWWIELWTRIRKYHSTLKLRIKQNPKLFFSIRIDNIYYYYYCYSCINLERRSWESSWHRTCFIPHALCSTLVYAMTQMHSPLKHNAVQRSRQVALQSLLVEQRCASGTTDSAKQVHFPCTHTGSPTPQLYFFTHCWLLMQLTTGGAAPRACAARTDAV